MVTPQDPRLSRAQVHIIIHPSLQLQLPPAIAADTLASWSSSNDMSWSIPAEDEDLDPMIYLHRLLMEHGQLISFESY